jgi:integrating conjugative element protein (TIGR03757 family)
MQYFPVFSTSLAVIMGISLAWSTGLLAEPLPEPITVLAFTDSRHYPLSHTDLPDVKVTAYDLAAPKLAMARVNAELKLPANPALATAMAKDYLKVHEAELGQQLLPTYAGLSQAVNLGLNQYPALVFNSQAVIIGVTDIQQGLAIYQ